MGGEDWGRRTEAVELRVALEEGEAGNRHADRNRRNPYRTCRVHWHSQNRHPRKSRWRLSHTTFRKCQGVWAGEGVEEDGDWEEATRVVVVPEAVETGAENMEDAEVRVEVPTVGEVWEVVEVAEEDQEADGMEVRVEEEDAEEGVAAWGEGEREEAVPAWHPCT